METESTRPKSLRNLLIIGGIAIAFVVVISVVIYALVVGSQKGQSGSSSTPAPWPRVATKEEITKNLNDLNKNLEQSKNDQTSASAILKNNGKQIKIDN